MYFNVHSGVSALFDGHGGWLATDRKHALRAWARSKVTPPLPIGGPVIPIELMKTINFF